jgi:uncharacterized Zn finger protein (UPF0148 family)
MNTSTRTPEGKTHTCRICGYQFRISPALAGDACCPICNTLVWPHGKDESEEKRKRRLKEEALRKKKKRRGK